MSIVSAFLDSSAVSLRPSTRPRPLHRRQAMARRNLLWLRATEAGIPDALTGRVRKHTPAELGELWDLSKQAVLNGINDARARRARIEVLSADA